MQRPAMLFPMFLAASIGLAAAGPSSAATISLKKPEASVTAPREVDLTTPEGAITAYLDGVARQDLGAVLATTSAAEASRKFDFLFYVEGMRTMTAFMPAPASDPLFIEINKAAFESQIARQVQFLVYGLMSTSGVLEGKAVQMDAALANDFMSTVQPARLDGLLLEKISIPHASVSSSERYKKNVVRQSRNFGADEAAERVALLFFEGNYFVVGFNLLRYGQTWTIKEQSSPLANLPVTGVPKRVTLQEFEKMLK